MAPMTTGRGKFILLIPLLSQALLAHHAADDVYEMGFHTEAEILKADLAAFAQETIDITFWSLDTAGLCGSLV